MLSISLIKWVTAGLLVELNVRHMRYSARLFDSHVFSNITPKLLEMDI